MEIWFQGVIAASAAVTAGAFVYRAWAERRAMDEALGFMWSALADAKNDQLH